CAPVFTTRILESGDYEEFRAMRLHSLESHPVFMPLIEDHASDKIPLEIERLWSANVWKSLLTGACKQQFFGLFARNALIGIGQVKELCSDVAELKSAFIKPEYRGLGLWRLLLDARVLYAIRSGYKEVRIGYRIGNTCMERALVGSGFVEIY